MINFDPTKIAGRLPFEERYELRRRRWLDGPHESWEAFDRVLEREVVVNRAYRLTDGVRFIKKAKIASALQHPNLLTVYDLGILENGIPFYTTPLVRAVPLNDLLRKVEPEPGPVDAPFPLRALVTAVRDACRAVEHAHRHGYLHLDIYPGNVLVEEGFQQVLLDVDWVVMSSQDGEMKVESFFSIRPLFTSPEQIGDRGAGFGPATDVFGLGGLLHVILFGTPPNHLPGKSADAVVRAIADRAFEPRRPGTLRPGIRSSAARSKIERLVSICLKALAYEPQDRYPSAAAFGADLDAWEETS